MRTRQLEWLHGWAGMAAALATTMAMGCSEEPGDPPMHPEVAQCMEEESCVTLQWITSLVTEKGIESRPHEFSDPSEYTAVSVQDDGTVVVRAAESPTPGYLVIRDVPAGPYYLKVGASYDLHVERFVDWNHYATQREDTVVVEQSTMIDLDIDGLAPWDDYDRLQLWVPRWGSRYTLPVYPEYGSESLVATVDYAAVIEWTLSDPPFLIDGDRGDRALIVQVSEWDGVVKRVLRVPAFVQVEGGTTTITGTLEPVEAVSRTVNCGIPELVSVLEGTKPGGVGSTQAYAALYTGPPELTGNFAGSLLLHWGPIPEGAATLEYADPMPDEWVQWIECFVSVDAVFAAVWLPLDQAVAGAIQPVVGPVENIRVDGQDASSTLSGISLSPEITWDAPAFGEVTAYEVQVREVTFGSELIAQFHLEDPEAGSLPTGMIIPPGILDAGGSYVLRVKAYSQPNDAMPPSTAPLARPAGYAERVTAVLTP